MTTTREQVPPELSGYLVQLAALVDQVLRSDLLGLWLIGSAAQGAYEHGISDVDVLAVSRSRWPLEVRRSLGRQLVHPTLPCPTAGLEFVWYARPDLHDPADPVTFQLNVNGGQTRASSVQLTPGIGPHYWSVLDLAAARHVGVPLAARLPVTEAVPPAPDRRLRQAVRESLAWHDESDAASPNRVLNLARLAILLDEGRWLSKPDAAAALARSHPSLHTVLEQALLARSQNLEMDPALAQPLSELVRDRLRQPSRMGR